MLYKNYYRIEYTTVKKNPLKRRIPLQRIVLATLAVGGTVTLAMVAPNVLAELRKIDPAFVKQQHIRRRIQETLWRMERHKMISLPRKGTMGRVEILSKGSALIEKIQASEYRIPEPMIWDGKWRMVMFDVPEQRRRVRDQLRQLLQSAGLMRLHDSVWVHPYPCDELAVLVKAHLKNIRGEIHYGVGELIESDRYLREQFGLL